MRTAKISTKKLVLLTMLGSLSWSASANEVGFYNIQVSTGDNWIANQVSALPDNTLDNVLINGVLANSTFVEMNPATGTFLPASIFNGTTWSINYDFLPNGLGGILTSPNSTTVTIAGDVVNLDNGVFSFVPPDRGAGVFLLAAAAPINAATFEQIVGRSPGNGESVTTLDPATQTTSTTTFNNGDWNNGVPALSVGQAGSFTLLVPEPSTWVLSVFGIAALIISRRGRFANLRN